MATLSGYRCIRTASRAGFSWIRLIRHSSKTLSWKDIADRTPRIDVFIDPLKIKGNLYCSEVLTVLREVKPSWFGQDKRSLPTLKTKIFTEGITNLLYGYYQEGKFDEDVVVVRVDGIGTELMVEREHEIKIIQTLSASDMSPPLYAAFNNGLAYGYVHGRTLQYHDITDERIRKLIAKEIVSYHSIMPDIPYTKTGFLDKVSSFLDMSPERYEDRGLQARLKENLPSKVILRREFQGLRAHIEALNSPVVFCHNDLLPKNIVYDEENGRVHFIDHEFAMYNYEHYELAAHFCEYAGINNDFSLYPNKTYQMEWLRYYLQQKAIHKGEGLDTVTDREVEICYAKTNKFALVAHFFCALFGLIQVKNSSIDFGYLEYAELKMGEYFARKEEFLALKVPQ